MNTKTFPPPLPPVEEASRSCTAFFAAADPAAPGPSAHRALRAEPPADGISSTIHQALDELSEELGIEL